MFGHFISLVFFFHFFSPSLEDSPILIEILSQRAVKPKTTSQPNPVVKGMRTPVYSCYQNACRSIDRDLTTHSVGRCRAVGSASDSRAKGPGFDTRSSYILLFLLPPVVSYWRKYVNEVLINHLGGLNLPRKRVVRLTDRPDMTIAVYRGRKTSQQHNNKQHNNNNYSFYDSEFNITTLCCCMKFAEQLSRW